MAITSNYQPATAQTSCATASLVTCGRERPQDAVCSALRLSELELGRCLVVSLLILRRLQVLLLR